MSIMTTLRSPLCIVLIIAARLHRKNRIDVSRQFPHGHPDLDDTNTITGGLVVAFHYYCAEINKESSALEPFAQKTSRFVVQYCCQKCIGQTKARVMEFPR
jgi:hypothetical protein